MKARDILTADVETVAPEDEISEVLTRLARADFSGFPVVDEHGEVVGVVTEEDLVDIFQPSDRTLWIPVGFPPFVETLTYGFDLSWDDFDVGVDLVKNARRSITAVMTTPVESVGPDADIGQIVDLLGDPDLDINRVPVIDDGVLLGIITRQDVLRALRSQATLV